MDSCTKSDSDSIYGSSITQYSNLQKLFLIACYLYIACKKNDVPRAIEEISGVTKNDINILDMMKNWFVNSIIKQKNVITCSSSKANWGWIINKLKKINQEIESYENMFCNPIRLCTARIRKTLTSSVTWLNKPENISGITISGIKRICKKIVFQSYTVKRIIFYIRIILFYIYSKVQYKVVIFH